MHFLTFVLFKKISIDIEEVVDKALSPHYENIWDYYCILGRWSECFPAKVMTFKEAVKIDIEPCYIINEDSTILLDDDLNKQQHNLQYKKLIASFDPETKVVIIDLHN